METFVAFLAVCVAALTLYIQRIHNRKSLLPILSTHISVENNKTCTLELQNNGQGIAFIDEIYLIYNEKKYNISDYRDFVTVIKNNMEGVEVNNYSVISTLKGNSSFLLLEIELHGDSCLESLIDYWEVEVHGRSIYGEKIKANDFDFLNSEPFEALIQKALRFYGSYLKGCFSKSPKS